MLGSNRDEGSFVHLGATPVENQEEYLAALSRVFGDSAEEVAALYPLDDFELPNDALVRVTGDFALVCPTYDTARRAAAGGADVYLYNFDRGLPIPALAGLRLGATHGAEIAYVFGSVTRGIAPEDVMLSETVRGYWGRFAASGDPNGDGALTWPRFTPDHDRRLNLNISTSVVSDFRRSLCEYWLEYYETHRSTQATRGRHPQ